MAPGLDDRALGDHHAARQGAEIVGVGALGHHGPGLVPGVDGGDAAGHVQHGGAHAAVDRAPGIEVLGPDLTDEAAGPPAHLLSPKAHMAVEGTQVLVHHTEALGVVHAHLRLLSGKT